MAFQSYFDSLPFNGSFDNGMPKFPFGGSYYGVQPQAPQAPASAVPSINPGIAGSGNQSNLNNISGMSMGGIDNTGPIPGGMVGDAQTYQFLSGFPSTGGDGGYAPFSPSGTIGSIGLGNAGQKFSDRLDSLTNTPYIDTNNLLQGAVNGAGLFSPVAGGLAGILQGLGLWEGGEPTGNPVADAAFTPGMVQQGSSYLTNQLWQLLGGTPLNGPPDASGPSGGSYSGVPMDPAGVGGGYVPPPDATPPAPIYQDNMDPGWGGAGSMDAIAQQDPFFATGGQAPNLGGADIFNSIGLAPWMTGDYGGGFGGGSPYNWGSENNGGWGQ